MIQRAVEDSPGGFAVVHTTLCLWVLDLLIFMVSMAVSLDPHTGISLDKVHLTLHQALPADGIGTPVHDFLSSMVSMSMGQSA